MFSEKKKCRKPEELKGTPGECSLEQIRKCHGEVNGHPCVEPGVANTPKDSTANPESVRRSGSGNATAIPEIIRVRKVKKAMKRSREPVIEVRGLAKRFDEVQAVDGVDFDVAEGEVFEAQTFSNFFRFPRIFLCGLFFPIKKLAVFLKPLSYVLPLTYGADALHGSVHGTHDMPFALDLAMLGMFCAGLFAVSLWNIKRKWIR
jgi:hypothetical protein